MVKLEKYNPAHTYMTPAGGLANAQYVTEKYPAASVFTHVVTTDEMSQVMWAFENLSAMRSRMGIDPTMSDDDAIALMEELLNAPEEEGEPSAEERIAAALEYQNVLSSQE